MATEIGGLKLSIATTQEGNSAGVADDFFKALFNVPSVGDIKSATLSKGDSGMDTFQAGGKTVKVAGDSYAGPSKLKISDDSPVIIGNSKIDKVVASKGDNKILVTDGGGHDIKTKGGDDVVMISGTGNNTVKAGAGNDTIIGGSGDDTLKGGAGNDKIEGGGGDDTLSGGAQVDTFVFKNEPTGVDVITDFSKQDVLQIADRTADGQVTVGKGGDVTAITQAGQDTVVVLKGGDVIVLKDVKADNLQEGSDGIFHI